MAPLCYCCFRTLEKPVRQDSTLQGTRFPMGRGPSPTHDVRWGVQSGCPEKSTSIMSQTIESVVNDDKWFECGNCVFTKNIDRQT